MSTCFRAHMGNILTMVFFGHVIHCAVITFDLHEHMFQSACRQYTDDGSFFFIASCMRVARDSVFFFTRATCFRAHMSNIHTIVHSSVCIVGV